MQGNSSKEIARSMQRFAAVMKKVDRALAKFAAQMSVAAKDIKHPPSRERRELRLIARAERAEAQVWWLQYKQRRFQP